MTGKQRVRRIVATACVVLAGVAGFVCAAPGARAADRPVVVELFTAQGCASCLPADELLNELVRARKDLLPLSFHVDYWNRQGWPDPFSSPEATERQRVYAGRTADPTLFTPQMIVDGTRSAIGSDLNQVGDAVEAAEDELVTKAPISVTAAKGEVVVTVGAGSGTADIVLVGYDRSHTTAIGRGENAGHTLTELNVVRSIDTIGAWNGSPVTIRRKAPPGQLFAAWLAQPDGRIVAVAAPGH